MRYSDSIVGNHVSKKTFAFRSNTGDAGTHPAHADTSDMKNEIRDLANQVDQIRDELEKRD